MIAWHPVSAQVYYEFKIKYRVELENNMAKILV
jgi:hypothetical protein